ncbi:MAG: formate dehydrogenase subunit alpha [Planctomycetes bacterium]|nr:formate dehydrogenase subunit alpha [Planctomycetota bacterium]
MEAATRNPATLDSVILTIDGRQVSVPAGTDILTAAKSAGIDIPHLCYDPRVEAIGACRMCSVKVEGARGLVAACGQSVAPGMQVITEDEELARRRKHVLELFLSEHCATCSGCDKSGACRLQDYAYRYQADPHRFGVYRPRYDGDNYTTLNKGILYDADKCIRCGLCVKYCETVQMAEALTFTWRADRMVVSTPGDDDLNDTSCELCGGCIRVCPTSAMLDKRAFHAGRNSDLQRVRTTCSYCGVGCQMDLMVDRQRNRIVRVTAEPGSPINDGNLCVKGHFGFEFVSSPERLTQPLIRRNGALEPATWDEALALIGSRMQEIRKQHGPDGLAFISSARCTNEENYLVQKIARAVVGTHNVDNCATSCHAPTVAGLAESFGSGAMTNSTTEIRDCKVLFLIGANPTEAHPIFGLEMKRALRRGAKLIVCDPRETWMAKHADIHIQHRSGSDNMLLNAMMRHIIDEGLADRNFIESRCEDYEAFAENLKGYTVEAAAECCGVDAELIRAAARMYAEGEPSAIYYTLGITEHACGTDNVKNVANLAMLCGQIGKWASGVNPLRGQNNVQGACDMGAMPAKLPGYQRWSDAEVRARFEAVWDAPMPQTEGLKIPMMIAAAGAELRALYVMGQDIVATEPNQAEVIERLKSLDFLVCQEIFLTETAKLAHVVLPSTTFAEKDGTFTCSERRVQLVRKAVEPPGEAKADWEILCLVAEALGKPMPYRDPAEIYDELASLSPMFAGISHRRIAEHGGLQWPCPSDDHAGTRFLHEGRFTRGKGRFHAIRHQPPREEPTPEFPLILSTGRTLYNYNCGSMSRKSAVISQKESANFVEIHRDTAARYGIADDEKIVVRTARGRVTARAAVGERVRPDTIWMPFHFAEESANVLTNDVFDPVTATAEYKCCAAEIEKLPAAGTERLGSKSHAAHATR